MKEMADNKHTRNPNPGSGDSQGKGTNPKPKFSVYWIYGIIGLAILLTYFMNMGNNAEEITWYRFEKEMLQNHEVERIVVVNKERVDVYIKKELLSSGKYKDTGTRGFSPLPKTGPQFYFTIGSVETLENNLQEAMKNFPEDQQIEIKFKTERNFLGELMGWLLPIFLLVAVWLFIFRRMSSGAGGGGAGNIFNVGKSKARIFDKDSHVKVDFKDVAGLEEAKMEVMEIVDFLKNPKKYTELGGKIPKGALLVGPPGTGKTLLAKAVAGEANVPFFSISGSDFVEMFVGVGASRVRDLFKQAKEKAPCIVFIDEIDAVGRARGRNPNFGANDERENTLNQLLTEMDGFDTNTGVIILAATNRADILDRALLRAGRFDRQIHVELPDLKERKEIFNVHLRPIKIEKKLEVDFLAKQTPGFSGADIANVCNEAALIAARKNKKTVQKQDFLDAIDRIIGGLEKKNKIISEEEKRTIAYHEAGHATVSWLLEHANPLVKVTIIPRGRALGAAWYLPEERQITTTEQLLDEMCSALGGRASEEITFGKISTGALNDLEKVTKQAYAMVSYFGMSEKVGNISFYDSNGQSEFSFNKPYSEKTAELIDEEVNTIVEEQYKRALKILQENREGLTKLGEQLLVKEVIFSEDLEKIFGKRTFGSDKNKSGDVEAAEQEQESPALTTIKGMQAPPETGPEISAEPDKKPHSKRA
jgi:cell division protease FtsH